MAQGVNVRNPEVLPSLRGRDRVDLMVHRHRHQQTGMLGTCNIHHVLVQGIAMKDGQTFVLSDGATASVAVDQHYPFGIHQLLSHKSGERGRPNNKNTFTGIVGLGQFTTATQFLDSEFQA